MTFPISSLSTAQANRPKKRLQSKVNSLDRIGKKESMARSLLKGIPGSHPLTGHQSHPELPFREQGSSYVNLIPSTKRLQRVERNLRLVGMSYSPHRPFPRQANPCSRRIGQVRTEVARNQ